MAASILSHCIEKGIRANPEAAAREIPQILEAYIIDNGALMKVFRAAERVGLQPDKFALELLARAVAEAKCPNP